MNSLKRNSCIFFIVSTFSLSSLAMLSGSSETTNEESCSATRSPLTKQKKCGTFAPEDKIFQLEDSVLSHCESVFMKRAEDFFELLQFHSNRLGEKYGNYALRHLIEDLTDDHKLYESIFVVLTANPNENQFIELAHLFIDHHLLANMHVRSMDALMGVKAYFTRPWPTATVLPKSVKTRAPRQQVPSMASKVWEAVHEKITKRFTNLLVSNESSEDFYHERAEQLLRALRQFRIVDENNNGAQELYTFLQNTVEPKGGNFLISSARFFVERYRNLESVDELLHLFITDWAKTLSEGAFLEPAYKNDYMIQLRANLVDISLYILKLYETKN